ncbi:tRNA pseudouridine(55) synthase TruB [Microscilla marina]|uniref:tRNA pseudouridine synthase B n=1 Tax=Microscilla marina ATCC 23134 TaxID=313606 RepID=A1ZFF8_MICM2|nr:tRNA pseudouridine(55) synthase TruB [Microscilla marina]EAY30732.1 tRNA pseudouridine synthase B [Microscilla marina ATCC 23134]
MKKTNLNELLFKEGEVLLLDKPLEWTSFDVVAKVRNLIRKKEGKVKVGHAGTLDPLATGLLILCTGKKTKTIEAYQAQQKEYTGEITLGATTPSFDAETEVNQTFDIAHIDESMIQETVQRFVGDIDQIPPMFSAVKVDGKRLYKHARKGQVVEIDPRKITIHAFEIIDITLPTLRFRVVCSKGTYIRSLARDFGKAMNAGAYLSALRRTKIGDFEVNDAYTVEEFMTLFEHLQTPAKGASDAK